MLKHSSSASNPVDVTQHTSTSVGNDGSQIGKRGGVFDVSLGKLHAADAVFKNVVGPQRLDLAIASPSDITRRVSASVTEAHGSAMI